MNIRRIKDLLRYSAIALVLATAGVVTAAALWPYDVPQLIVPSGADTTATPRPQQRISKLPALSTFADVWNLNIRRPLHGQTTPVRAQPVKKATPALSARLAGTVVERGHSVAMFITKAGKIELKRVGETLGDAKIRSITQAGVSVQYHGQIIDLELKQDKPK